MQLPSFLTAAPASGVASRVLNLGAGTAHNSQMGPARYNVTERPATPSHTRPQRHVGRKIKFKRDGSVTGFLDDDYANDADWEKFTNKGGALVRHAEATQTLCGTNLEPRCAASMATTKKLVGKWAIRASLLLPRTHGPATSSRTWPSGSGPRSTQQRTLARSTTTGAYPLL